MFASTRSRWVGVVTIILILGGGWIARAYGFAGGTGEPNNPYQIATVADLLSIGSSFDLANKSFVLVNDLDLDPNLAGGRVFDKAVIGQNFSGVFDGQGHAIHHLRISAKIGSNGGLFWIVRGGLVKDLHLKDVQLLIPSGGALAASTPDGIVLRCSVTGKVTGSGANVGGLIGDGANAKLLHCESQADVSGSSSVGGLLGRTAAGAQIAESHATGVITGSSSVGGLAGSSDGTLIQGCSAQGQVVGTDQVGGLVGAASFQTTIVGCEAQTDVKAGSKVGGLAGSLSADCQVVECRVAGAATGTNLVGGLIGSGRACTARRCAVICDITAKQTAGGLLGDTSIKVSVVDCYARGSVAGSLIGGLTGGDSGASGSHVYVLNSYAACTMVPLAEGQEVPVLGGLVGSRKPPYETFTTVACFWDTELSQVLIGTGAGPMYCGTGLTTKQMQQPDAFRQAGWDFDSTWTMAKDGYPQLRWEKPKEETIDANAETSSIHP